MSHLLVAEHFQSFELKVPCQFARNVTFLMSSDGNNVHVSATGHKLLPLSVQHISV